MEQSPQREQTLRRVFRISIFLKAGNAILEIVGGVLLLFTKSIFTWVVYLAQNELIEDPGDFVARGIQHYLPYLSDHAQLFAAFYLLSHGIVKIFLAVGLLRNKLWAYPSAIVVFILFILYQVYRYTYTHSFFLVLLTVFDLVVVWLTWHEYKVMKALHE
ncbi:MAG: DUF2127 domain-containing protein [Minisyncoccota bacterium]